MAKHATIKGHVLHMPCGREGARKRERGREGMPKDIYFCKEQAMAGCGKDKLVIAQQFRKMLASYGIKVENYPDLMQQL